jgi:hypothetical protein
MMSHKEFVIAYENGSLGCSVSVFMTLRLLLGGKIREKKVVINLFLWALSLVVLVIVAVIGFLNFAVVWALLGTAAMLVIYILAFFYRVGDLVLSAALASEEFFEFVKVERVLWIYSDDENNLPKAHKTVSMPHARRPRGKF